MANFGANNGAEKGTFAGTESFTPPVPDLIGEVLNKVNQVAAKLDDVSLYTLGFPPEKIAGVKALLDLAGSLTGDGPLSAVAKVPETLAALYKGNVTFIGMADLITDQVVKLMLGRADTLPGPMPVIMHDSDQIVDDVGVTRTVVESQGSTDLSAIRNDIWSLPDDIWNLEKMSGRMVSGSYSMPLWEVLMYAYDTVRYFLGTTGLTLPGVPDFTVVIGDPAWLPDAYAQWGDTTSIVRPGPILLEGKAADETLLAYLTRTQPTFAWSYTGPDGVPAAGTDTIWAPVTGMFGAWWRCRYTDSQLAVAATIDVPLAPVFPGLDGVEYQTPVVFTGSDEITDAMDGILLEITQVAPGQGKYTEGHATRYPYLGWLTFYSDTGDSDGLQKIEYEHQVFTPLHMVRPAGCVWYVKAGTEGVLTPYDILQS